MQTYKLSSESSRWYFGVIIAYFLILLVLAPIHLLSFDSYYYWEWSRHLSLSYYDGPPMIAYLIKCATFVFGDTLLALASVNIVVAALTCWILYHTARLVLSKEASYIVVLLWLFSPLVTLDLLKQTTYDCPLTLFWTATVYFSSHFIRDRHPRDLLLIGASIGLMLLSKYSGVVLILALMIFLILSSYRYVLKTWAFYAGVLLALLLFSPVLIWNYQYDWLSFRYQLTTHQRHTPISPWNAASMSMLTIIIPSLNLMLLTPFCCLKKLTNYPKQAIIFLWGTVSIVVLGFYILVSSHSIIRCDWLTPYLLTAALLGGFCYQCLGYRKSCISVVFLYFTISFVMLINSTQQFLPFVSPKKWITYQLIRTFNASYTHLPQIVVTTGWFEARMLFFLKGKPAIYTIPCGMAQNHYALWSKPIVSALSQHTLTTVLFVDTYNQIGCVEPYFKRCDRLFVPPYFYQNHFYQLYVYRCTNREELVL